ncbi:MAG: ATP-binding protein, partial [Candidatus Aenigmarchaeota archaeon]|nr:ATP-binding protein [Candidatus Aenigmarchaeota archaeon]
MKEPGVFINDELTDPLGDYVIDYLLSQTKETSFHDFKWTIDVSKNSIDFPKIVKDVFAFTNYGGGFIVVGVKPNDHSNKDIKGSFVKVGVPDGFDVDQSSLQEKINSCMDTPLTIQYTQFEREINGVKKHFALVYIPPSSKIMTPTKDGDYTVDGKQKKAFSAGQIFTRRGTASVPASEFEINGIKKRLVDENYRLSIRNGEPDKIEETLLSNMFEVKQLPKVVYVGVSRFNSSQEVQEWLDENHPENRYFFFRSRPYEDKIVSFQNLEDPNNFHSNLVYRDQVTKEPTENWLDRGPKERIIVSLLNKEVAGKGQLQGMRYFEKGKKLFYSTNYDSRQVSWPSRYKGVSTRTVAKKLWAEQLNRQIYWHASIKTSFLHLRDKFYLKLNLTAVITDDGKHVSTGMGEGTVITRKSYNTFNNQYLN